MLSLYHFKFGVSYCQCCSITIVINTIYDSGILSDDSVSEPEFPDI